MKKGINAWCFPTDFTIEKCMMLAKQAGFDSIELNISEVSKEKGFIDTLKFEENYGFTLDANDETLMDIYKLSLKIGIEISSVSTSLHWSYPVTSNDELVAGKGIEIIKKMIHAAKVFHTDAILVVPGIVDESVSYKTAYERSIEAFKEIGKMAQQEKVYVCLENVWNKFLLSPIEMNEFIDKIGCGFVQAYFDVGNVLDFSYPEYWIEILKSKIKRVHVKDYNRKVGNINGFCNLLQGNVNWKKVMESLHNINYDGYVTAELSPYHFSPELIAEDTSRHLEHILKF